LTSELLVSRAGGRTCTALREDGVTVELRVEEDAAHLAVGHIVKARVSKVLPGIQSAFLDLGHERDAFLHVSDLLLPGEAASSMAYALGAEGEVEGEDAAPPASRAARTTAHRSRSG
jgi:ribonuclease G